MRVAAETWDDMVCPCSNYGQKVTKTRSSKADEAEYIIGRNRNCEVESDNINNA